MNIKTAVNAPAPIYKNIEVIQDNIVILDGKDYSELIKNIINYSKYVSKTSINYNAEKSKYYLKDKTSKQAGDWDSSFSKSTDKDDCWFLLDALFNEAVRNSPTIIAKQFSGGMVSIADNAFQELKCITKPAYFGIILAQNKIYKHESS